MIPPPFRTNLPSPPLSVLSRQIEARKRANTNVHNLAKTMFTKGIKVMFKANQKAYFGTVVEVIGTPGDTWLRLVNLSTKKQRDIRVEDITGIVQED